MIKHDSNQLRRAALVGTGVILGILLMLGGSTYRSLVAGSAVVAAQSGCQTFAETGHKVCGRFLDYWNTHGGLAQQGYPLSEEFSETSTLDGLPHTVQYFERAVFERHPENALPYDVLLAQLGTYQGRANYPQGFPATAGQVPFYEDRTDPVAALVSFYNAITRKEYQRAYSYFQGAPNPAPALVGPYAGWVQGYATTTAVTVATGKAVLDAGAGNIYAAFPVALTATHTDGSSQVFSGCYVMHRINAGISPNPNDALWSINAAQIGAAPANASVAQLLAQTCNR